MRHLGISERRAGDLAQRRIPTDLQDGIARHVTVREVPRRATQPGGRVRTSADVRVARARSPLLLYRRMSLWLGVCDALSLMCASVAARVLTAGRESLSIEFVLTLGAGCAIWIGIFHAFGLYGLSRLSVRDECRGIISAAMAGVILLTVVSYWLDQPLSRSWLGWTLLLVLSIEFVIRWLFRSVIKDGKREGHLALRTLIVGMNDESLRLWLHMASPASGFVPIGCVNVSNVAAAWDGIPVLGNVEDLENIIHRDDIDCVFVASTAASPEEIRKIPEVCRRTTAEIRVSTNLSHVRTHRLSIQSIDGVISFAIKPARLTATGAISKRGLDLVVGSVALFLALPFIAVIALAIRLTSRGPAFYLQKRVTKDGEVFTMYKFRTMVGDLDPAPDGGLIDLTQPYFKLQTDSRVTRVGRVLRSLSLDELPQLWNVIRGQMSLVGPRPLPVEQVLANEQLLNPRHEVKGGLTGLWQISGRSDLDSVEALRIDRFYIENWSLSLDLYILIKTIGVVFARRGAM
jgi:exopolysaccharide biosynthesis polyprenyl glycosylphosphotransferase